MQLETARQLHRQGRLAEAERLYRQILAVQPTHPEALHLLGILAMSVGHVDAGVGLLQQSVQAKPAQPAVLLDLVGALLEAHRWEEAFAACERALALQPDWPEALFLRANACMLLVRPLQALETYDRLLKRVPAHVAGWCNRGNALHDLGRSAEAVQSYDSALALRPDLFEAHNNRGNALRALARFEAALASYDRALQWQPLSAQAHHNRGIALHELDRLEEALVEFERAVGLDPAFVDAHNHRGNVLRDLLRPEAALASYERVLALDPSYAEALSNRGNALLDLERFESALESYDRALRGLPNSPDVLANRATALQELARYDEAVACLANLLRISPRYDYAAGNLLQAKLHVCEWSDYAELVAKVVAGLDERQRVAHPFPVMTFTQSAAVQLCAAQLHAAEIKPRGGGSVAARVRPRSQRLRVAYVSADFREHAVSYLLAGVFEHHDRERIESSAISLRPPEHSAMGERIGAGVVRFVDVSRRSDAEVAALMRELQIDIAVDLMGYTHHARPGILSCRPAPVLVSYLGYPGTMGAPFIDYILADEFVIPPAAREHYSEQVVYLPECFQANDDRCVIGTRPTRAEAGLPEQALVLCCFNNNYKLNPPLFDIWMRLLREIPGSVLWLLGDRAGTQGNLQREAVARGVDERRLVFAGRMPYAQHLGRLGLADLFLDTLPYNAGATASDALRSGVPVLTCAGEAFVSRMAGSLLRAVGLSELITGGLSEYEHTALTLLREPQRLQDLRARLAENLQRTPLFDTQRFCRHLEAAYFTMSERAANGLPPAAFTVSEDLQSAGLGEITRHEAV
jgi:protein O-GlcNAc transferase